MTSEEEGKGGDLRNLETTLVASVQKNEKEKKRGRKKTKKKETKKRKKRKT